MIPSYKIITAIIGIVTGIIILYLVRKDKLSVNYSLWWGSMAGVLILLGLAPSLIDVIGRKVGIYYPPILIVIIAICLIFIKLLFMDIHRSKHEQQIRVLAQRLALYEKEKEE